MTFNEALKTKDFVVTGQLNLANAPDAESLLRQGETLGAAVDAVQLLDSKQPHISGVAAAALLLRNGVDPIIHMNCRDRNRLALQKDLLGHSRRVRCQPVDVGPPGDHSGRNRSLWPAPGLVR